MKKILFLLLFPCLALAQYQGNANQKITLGEQTTADGLVFRGVANDTNVITPFSDTSAYIILDTVNSKFYHYNRTTTFWALAGGGGDSGGVTSFSAGTTGLTPSTATTGAVTLGGTLAVANGGTGASVKTFVDTFSTQTVNGVKTFTDTMRIEDAIKVGTNNAYVYSAGTGNYYFTKDYKNQNGLYHIAIGNGVLSNATTVSNPTSSRHGSVAIGFDNLKNLTQSAGTNQGVYNTSIGINNMSSVTTGGFNTSVGALSLKLLTTGGSNVAIGTTTLENMTTGGSNLGLGDGAFRFVSTGSNNVGIGSNAGVFDAVNGNQVTSIDNSIYIGQRADPSATTGVNNEIAIGYLAKGQGSNTVTFGNTNTTKTIFNGNVGIGTASPTEKLHVVGNGLFTGSVTANSLSLTTPLSVANGGTGATTYGDSTLLQGRGTSAISSSTDLLFNYTTKTLKVNGLYIGLGNSNVSSNIKIGNLATLSKNAAGGNTNTAIGSFALENNTTGDENLAIGSYAMNFNTTGGYSVAIGANTLYKSTTANFNCAIGRSSLQELKTGTKNVAIGGNDTGYATDSTNNSTIIGTEAGAITTLLTGGTNNTLLGYRAISSTGTVSNEITLGNSSIATIRAQVTTITSLSDARDKSDILPLHYGMNFIEKLKPVSFVWNMRDGGKIGISDIGFIAQDLQKAQIDTNVNVPNLVSGTEDKLEAGYGVLLPIIVKALQEANEKIKSLEQRILTLENK